MDLNIAVQTAILLYKHFFNKKQKLWQHIQKAQMAHPRAK